MNGPVFVAAVIEREEWEADISFVGHQNTIQVAVSCGLSDVQEHLLTRVRPSTPDSSSAKVTSLDERRHLLCSPSVPMTLAYQFGGIQCTNRWWFCRISSVDPCWTSAGECAVWVWQSRINDRLTGRMMVITCTAVQRMAPSVHSPSSQPSSRNWPN